MCDMYSICRYIKKWGTGLHPPPLPPEEKKALF